MPTMISNKFKEVNSILADIKPHIHLLNKLGSLVLERVAHNTSTLMTEMLQRLLKFPKSTDEHPGSALHKLTEIIIETPSLMVRTKPG
jgi:hypothetical protein